MDFITAKHSFNTGDCLTILPGLKHLSEKNSKKVKIYQRLGLQADYGHDDPHPIKDDKGRHVCMNEKMFDAVKPLVEYQDYIESFEIWNGQEVDINFDLTRHNSQMPLPNGPIHKWASLIFPQLECSLDEPWIKTPPCEKKGTICLNFTARYRNEYISYFFLKEHQDRCVFIGTFDEWKDFVTKWSLFDVRYVYTGDLLHAAKAIRQSSIFIGNQSACWHIADAMKVPRILEVCARYPNTFPTGKNGYSFITQEALEFRFHKLLNESNG